MKREEIDFKNAPIDKVIEVMAEKNPGAISVLSQIARTDPTLLVDLDDMNIRGWQVWYGYKDCCHERLETFLRRIRQRDGHMVLRINSEVAKHRHHTFRPKAVTAVGHNPREGLL